MAGTTPNYALPYPSPPDPADVPADMQALATRLDLVLPDITYQERSTDVSVPAGTPQGSAVVVHPGVAATYEAKPVWVEFFAAGAAATAGGSLSLGLFDGATLLAQWGVVGATVYNPVLLRGRLTPTAASHTYGVRAWGQGYILVASNAASYVRTARI